MTRIPNFWLGVVIAACLGLACSDRFPDSNSAALTPASSGPTFKVILTNQGEAEAEEVVIETAATRGQRSYLTYCASCHGDNGGGDGPLSSTLDPTPARHNDGAYMNALSDDHIFQVVKLGGASVGKSPTMAAWGGSLQDDQIRDVIVFVRSLADPPYQP